MRKRTVRAFALMLAVLLCFFTQLTAFAYSYNSYVISSAGDSEITELLAAIDIQNIPSPGTKAAKDVIRHFVFDSTYAAIGGARFPYPNSASSYFGTVSDNKYTVTGIAAKGCFAYAKFVSGAIYGTSGSLLDNPYEEAEGRATAAKLKLLIQTYAQAGEHLRIVERHSVAYISCTDEGFWFMDYGGDYSPYISLCYTTYTNFANKANECNRQIKLYNACTALNTETPEPVPIAELKGTVMNGESCLSVYASDLSFSDADAYCKQNGGKLAGISDSVEQAALEKLLKTKFPYACRLGGYRSDGAWKWSTGEDFAYTNWADGKIGSGSYIAVCGNSQELSGAGVGKWFDASNTSSIPKGFVMESSIKKLTLDKKPDKTTFMLGEELDLSGIALKAQYNNGYTAAVPIGDIQVEGFDSSKYGNATLQLYYGQKNVTLNIFIDHDHEFGTLLMTEAIHPHRYYYACVCGEKRFTGDNSYNDACPECNPMSLIPGDVDFDGNVTTDDARLALRFTVGLETLTDMQQAASDVDGIPGVTTDDARAILRYVVGLGVLYELVL